MYEVLPMIIDISGALDADINSDPNYSNDSAHKGVNARIIAIAVPRQLNATE